MPSRSAEQERAAEAYAFVAAPDHSKALEECKNLPFMLQTNGLLATWAYLRKKAKRWNDPLLETLAKRLGPRGSKLIEHGEPAAIFAACTDSIPGSVLRQLTEESIAFAVWLKRAAEGAMVD